MLPKRHVNLKQHTHENWIGKCCRYLLLHHTSSTYKLGYVHVMLVFNALSFGDTNMSVNRVIIGSSNDSVAGTMQSHYLKQWRLSLRFSRRFIWKFHLQNVDHFVPMQMCLLLPDSLFMNPVITFVYNCLLTLKWVMLLAQCCFG